MPQIRGIAIDLEGPGFTVDPLHFKAFSFASTEIGLTLSLEDMVREIPNTIGGGDKLISEGISRLSGHAVNYEEILKRKRFYYNELIESLGDSIELRPGFIEVLDYIVNVVLLPIAIGSLTPRNQAKVLLERTGLHKWFPPEMVVLAEDVKNIKPAPDVYLETARRMGISPRNQLVFDDSATGVKAAVAAGSTAVATPVYHHMPETLKDLLTGGATRIIWDWREINVESLITNINKLLRKGA